MGKDKIRAVAVHTVPHPDRGALREEINLVYARHIRSRLDESPLSPGRKKQALDDLIARIHLLEKQNNGFG